MTENRGAPSARVLELEAMDLSALERLFLDGETPKFSELTGWEFRGLNSPTWFRLLGIKKFIKGFEQKGDRVLGYNTPVRQNSMTGPWLAKPNDEKPKRFGFYEVSKVDPKAQDNKYLHAVLLDYGKGDNPIVDPSRGLRDYLVKLEEDIFLGKAYFALGGARLPTFSFFILERHRKNSA